MIYNRKLKFWLLSFLFQAFLIAEISVYNCVDIIHVAEKYQLNSVEEKAYNFVAEHLNELVKTEEIQVKNFYLSALYLFVWRSWLRSLCNTPIRSPISISISPQSSNTLFVEYRFGRRFLFLYWFYSKLILTFVTYVDNSFHKKLVKIVVGIKHKPKFPNR